MASQLLPLGTCLLPMTLLLKSEKPADSSDRTHRQVRRVPHLGRHEGRQRYALSLLPYSAYDRPMGTNNSLSEFAGTLVGFDDYVSTLHAPPPTPPSSTPQTKLTSHRHGHGRCHRVVSTSWSPPPAPLQNHADVDALSDYSGNHTKLKKILLNGNNICMVSSPGLVGKSRLSDGIGS